jgi:hypothetical protein
MQREFEWALSINKRDLMPAINGAILLGWKTTAETLYHELWKTWQGGELVEGRVEVHMQS